MSQSHASGPIEVVGIGSGSEGPVVTSIKMSSGDRLGLPVGKGEARVHVAGAGAVVEIRSGDGKRCLLFAPSSSGGMVDLGSANEFVA